MKRKERRRAAKRARGKGRAKGPNPHVDPAAVFSAAVADFEAGRLDAADAALKNIDRDHPGIADVTQLRGMIALRSGRPGEAVPILRRGVEMSPDSSALADLLGTAFSEGGNFEDAETAYRRALITAPGDAGVLNNLGNVLKNLGRFEESRDAYLESLERRPGHADTELNLAGVLENLEDYEGAEAASRRSIAAAPGDPDAHANLARMLLAQGKLDEVEAAAKRALELDPRRAEAHEVLGIYYFLRGRLSDAWEAYEWRWREEADRRGNFTQPTWSGEPVAGKTLLVWGEQGVGDEVLFAGMLPDLLDAGADIVLECDERIIPIFERSFEGVEYLARNDDHRSAAALEGIDFQVPLGSLGRWLRPDFDSFPRRESYLVADETRTAALRDKYREDSPGLVVGVAWRSENPRIGRDKSIPLMELRPLLELPQKRFVDLQYGDTIGEREILQRETGQTLLHDDDIDQMADLDAFTAQVAAMDLIVSISNTTVHVAGALGVPTWIMLPMRPMWRWMADREDSPWYPSVRLFRQSVAGQWTDVIERVVAMVSDFAAIEPHPHG